MRSLCRLVFFLGLTFITARCFAQTAAITGQIQDASGAIVTGAEVRVVEQSQGTTRTLHTNKAGAYSAPFLNPGSYRVYVQAQSFSTAASEPLVLTVGQTLVFNVTLRVGGPQQEVTVNAGTSVLNTTDASVSTVVDQKFVENMPLNGRSFQDLISMTPGVITASPQSSPAVQTQGDFSVNGQRTESNYYTVDGVAGNVGAGYPNGTAQNATSGSVASSTALGTTQSLVSVDALQEFRVTSSTYSAEFGRNPGGQFSLVTRSGTNDLHGSLFNYLRNDVFDANNWFNDYYGTRKTPLRQNDFGGTLGGPLSIPHLYSGKDRTFFFVSYEGMRLVQPTAATLQYVPSLSIRSSSASSIQPLLSAFPLPTGSEILTSSGSATGLAPFTRGYSLPGAIDATSVRFDEKVGNLGNAFFRFATTPTYTTSRVLSALFHQNQDTHTFTGGLDTLLWKGATNSLRIGYSSSTSQQQSVIDGFGGATPTDFQSVLGVPGTYSTYQYYPYIYISGVGSTYLTQYKTSNQLRQWNVTDTLSKLIGHHQIKVGIDQRRFDSPLNPAQMGVYPYYYSRTSMLNNVSDLTSIIKDITADPLFQEFSAFVQDDWRIAPTLSIAAGIRWEVNPAPSAADGNMAYTALGDPHNPATLTLAPRGSSLWNTSWFNLAPRLGVAWTPHTQSGRETVVRTGGGVFFDTGNQQGANGFSGLGFSALSQLTNATLPLASSAFGFSTAVTAPYTSGVVYLYPRNMQLPYTLQWNASVDQSLGRAQVMTISYVGSAGRRLIERQYLSVNALNKNFKTISYYPTGITSNYQALQLKFQRTVAQGLQALASYTWSHSLDYGSTNASIPLTYGNSDFDVRHNLQAGLTWSLPSHFANPYTKAALGGWGLDGRINIRSGFPITLLGNTLVDATGSRYYSGANYNPSRPIYLYGNQYPGGRMINGGPSTTSATAAFTLPTGLNAGNAPRNFVRGFGANQFNVAIRRDFNPLEHFKVTFRAEAFNVVNHPTFGYIDPTLTDAQFGQPTMTLNSSLGSMSSLYQQGGPRSLQLSIHLAF